MSTFTVTKIDKELGHVSVIYSIDGIEQTMCDAPLNSADDLTTFLNDYGNRYEASINAEREESVVPSTIDSLVGKPLELNPKIQWSNH